MSELIYKEDAKEYVRRALENDLDPVSTIDKCLEADIPTIVRCKDCIWYKESKLLPGQKFCYRLKDIDGLHVGYNFSDNDFCSHAEEKRDAPQNNNYVFNPIINVW